MSNEYNNMLSKARAMLVDAKTLNEDGQHGKAMKLAYHSSEYVAATYLLRITGTQSLPNAATFEVFSDSIQRDNRHPDFESKIGDVVGDVYVLREAYEPALLNETTRQDAQQMLGRVSALVELVEKIVK